MSLSYKDGQAIPVHKFTDCFDVTYAYNVIYTDGTLEKEEDEESIFDGSGYKKSKNVYLKDATYAVVIWASLIEGTSTFAAIYMKEPHKLLDELRLKRDYALGNVVVPEFAPAKKNPVIERTVE